MSSDPVTRDRTREIAHQRVWGAATAESVMDRNAMGARGRPGDGGQPAQPPAGGGTSQGGP